MTTPSLTRGAAKRRDPHAANARVPKDPLPTERSDPPFDLTETAYRVILGCCKQEDSNSNCGRLTPAKDATPIRVKEVIS